MARSVTTRLYKGTAISTLHGHNYCKIVGKLPNNENAIKVSKPKREARKCGHRFKQKLPTTQTVPKQLTEQIKVSTVPRQKLELGQTRDVVVTERTEMNWKSVAIYMPSVACKCIQFLCSAVFKLYKG